MRPRAVTIALALSCAACQARGPAPCGPMPARTFPNEPLPIKAQAQAQAQGPATAVTLHGVFDIDRVRTHVGVRGWLYHEQGEEQGERHDSGERTRVWLPEAQLFEQRDLIERRVIAKGRRLDLRLRAGGAHQLALTSLQLVPGECPRADVERGLPAPPVVRSAAEVAAREERWVQVIGVADEGEETGSEVVLYRFRFADGSAITVDLGTHELQRRLVALERARVTGRVYTGEGGVHVTGYAVCPADVLRCGVASAPRR